LTIIFSDGGNFWMEFIALGTITLEDAAGRYLSADSPLERPGVFVGGSIVQRGGPDNDNTQAIASFDLREVANASLLFAEFITAVSWRITKSAGTAGSTAANGTAIIFLRKRGSPT